MGLSYNGVWGYHPLVVSLANTKEVLYLVNRPGNAPSHQDSVPWIDRAVALVKPFAGQITIRGDTDFSNTAQLDRWDTEGVKFILGLDANPKVVKLAEDTNAQIQNQGDAKGNAEALLAPQKEFGLKILLESTTTAKGADRP